MTKKPDDKWIAREAAFAYGSERTTEWVSAADFKARCLRLVERVEQGRGEVVVTRYGRPVARLIPFDAAPASLFGFLAGSVVHYGDLVSPVGEPWDADA